MFQTEHRFGIFGECESALDDYIPNFGISVEGFFSDTIHGDGTTTVLLRKSKEKTIDQI